jgi:glycosyltransferase involved in cell wall biosynthesis
MMDRRSGSVKYSVVIPVYNSAVIVGETVDRTVAFFEKQGWSYELILVNDGSRDRSWDVLREKAQGNSRIVAVNLLHNYGQHTAVYCGLEISRGDYVITLDDDLQNPPEEIVHLVEKANEGHDVVYGRYQQKKHTLYRRLGSKLIGAVNRRIFGRPAELVLTNFRLVRRDVVERVCAYRTVYPYITGLTIMFAANPANVWVEHHERGAGESQYSLLTILKLVMRILFNYSAWPLRVVSTSGMIVAGLSFALGLYYLGKRLFGDVSVPGWTTVVVLLSFFNGISLLVLGMLGEYVVRLLNEVNAGKSYHIREIIGFDA